MTNLAKEINFTEDSSEALLNTCRITKEHADYLLIFSSGNCLRFWHR